MDIMNLKSCNDYINYADQLIESFDILEKKQILYETINLYNEMNSFINDNIIDLDYDSKLYTEANIIQGKGLRVYTSNEESGIMKSLKDIWNFLNSLVQKIVDAVKKLFDVQTKKQDETIALVKELKEKIEKMEKEPNKSISSNEETKKEKKGFNLFDFFKSNKKDKNEIEKKAKTALVIASIAPTALGAVKANADKGKNVDETAKSTIEKNKDLMEKKDLQEIGKEIVETRTKKLNSENQKVVEEVKKDNPESMKAFESFIGCINNLDYISYSLIYNINIHTSLIYDFFHKEADKNENKLINPLNSMIKNLNYLDFFKKAVEEFIDLYDESSLDYSRGYQIRFSSFKIIMKKIIDEPKKIIDFINKINNNYLNKIDFKYLRIDEIKNSTNKEARDADVERMTQDTISNGLGVRPRLNDLIKKYPKYRDPLTKIINFYNHNYMIAINFNKSVLNLIKSATEIQRNIKI